MSGGRMESNKFSQYVQQYRDALLNDVIPFWVKHSLDRVNGGFFHSLDRDGSVIDTDKYMWPQNRQIWTFCNLYRNVEQKQEWLEIAKLGIDFLKKHGRDEKGDWYFALTADGRPVVQPYNIFSDYFAVMAFSEYAQIAGDAEAMDIALKTFERTQKRLDNPKGKYNKLIIENRNFKNLAVPMIQVNVAAILNRINPDPKYEKIIADSIREVMTEFVDDSAKVVHENVTPAGGKVDSYEGRQVNPGHGIETMWFIMMAADKMGDKQTVKKACEVSKWCMEFGWDKEYGGIYYFMDKYGKPHPELQWDMKLWWPHLEAVVALLLGYKLTGDRELLAWFKKVHDYMWSHFPDKEFGEWFGYLNRQGEVNNLCKGNRWKACFHLPRTLYLIPEICKNLQ